jgi:hypothetical protein
VRGQGAYVPACVGQADAGGVAVELARPERGGDGFLGLGGGAEGREHGGVPVRQRQHGPRVARVHARADLEPHRADAHLVPRRRQRALLRRPREPPLRRRVAVPVAFDAVLRGTGGGAVLVVGRRHGQTEETTEVVVCLPLAALDWVGGLGAWRLGPRPVYP